MADIQHTVTTLLHDLPGGDRTAFDRLLPLVYDELRALAASQLRRERPDHTLQPTALVHEAYLRLVGQDRSRYRSRGHFLAVAAQAMRRILVDHARRKRSRKRSGGAPADLTPGTLVQVQAAEDVLAVDEALDRLARLDPRQARVVEFRYFVGLSIEDTAEALGVSPATVKRDWVLARAWLQREIEGRV
jgi:RNA polymerase sigma-70 factor (ECF subfamily)